MPLRKRRVLHGAYISSSARKGKSFALPFRSPYVAYQQDIHILLTYYFVFNKLRAENKGAIIAVLK